MKTIQYFFLTLCILTAFGLASAQTVPIFDDSFAPIVDSFAGVNALAIQPDGKILAAGSFQSANGEYRYSVARFNTDGSLDNSFSVPISQAFVIQAIGVQSSGKIILGGLSISAAGVPSNGLLRVNPDGSIDSAFAARPNSIVNKIIVQPDDKIIVGGGFTAISNQGRSRLARLNADGTIDTSFTGVANASVSTIERQQDGKLLISGSFTQINSVAVPRVARLNNDGSLDSSFAPNGGVNSTINSFKVQADGKIIIGGIFTTLNGVASSGLARLNTDGTTDNSFNVTFSPTTSNQFSIATVAIDENGKILIGGNFSAVNSVPRSRLARLNSDGTIDATFSPGDGANNVVRSIVVESGGTLLIIGDFINVNGTVKYRLARINADGSTSSTFAAAVNNYSQVDDVEIQPDGRILVGGFFESINGTVTNSVARLLPNGTIDSTFSAISVINSYVPDIKVAPDGKILVAGELSLINDSSTIYGLVRLNSDGTLDNTFTPVSYTSNISGYPTVITLLANNQILLGGGFTQLNSVARNYMARINADGSVDTTFNAQIEGAGNGVGVSSIIVRPDGKILIGGGFQSVSGNAQIKYLGLLNQDGTPDSTFPSSPNGIIYRAELLNNGSILVSGNFNFVGNESRTTLARLNPNGTLDSSFNLPNGLSISPIRDFKVYTDGRIIVPSGLGSNNAPTLSGLFVLNSNGSFNSALKTTTGVGGFADAAIQSDGKIIIVGTIKRVGGRINYGIARLNSINFPQLTLFDFDGDARADVSVFRPSTGAWFINGSQNGFSAVQFGAATDRIAPADFDGDGKTDVAVMRPSNGVWYILNSATSTVTSVQFGSAEDLPRPANFDGDGRADIAVFRPSTGTWFRLNSSDGAFSSTQFGANGDIPQPADFDGDGKADLNVYRPSNGSWFRLNSTNGAFAAVQFGANGDVPDAADFDGDGKADVNVFRPSNGVWYRLNSSNEQVAAVQFGTAGDIPAAADFDGDGKADQAVFRSSNGTWYLNRSSSGFFSIQFGVNGDVPTPSASGQ